MLRACTACYPRLSWPADKLDPAPLLDGDLLQQHGFQPGPQFRLILDAVRRAQLDGEISTTRQALEIASRMLDESA